MASVGNPVTILLVDDDEAIRTYVRPILEQEGFYVIEASRRGGGVEGSLPRTPILLICC
jgi:DNA-binding response OmpR family regulator